MVDVHLDNVCRFEHVELNLNHEYLRVCQQLVTYRTVGQLTSRTRPQAGTIPDSSRSVYIVLSSMTKLYTGGDAWRCDLVLSVPPGPPSS